MAKSKYFFILMIFVILLIFVLLTFAILFPISDNTKHNLFENVEYKNETEGLKEDVVLFSNLHPLYNLVPKIKEPNISLNESYLYSYLMFGRCSLHSHSVPCVPSRESNKSFFIIKIEREEKHNLTAYIITYINENNTKRITLPIVRNFSNQKIVEEIFKNSSNCENFICTWFLYVTENFTLQYRLERTYNLKELKDRKIFDEYIWRGIGREKVNGRDCFKVEIIKREFSGITEKGHTFPFIYLNETITLKFKVSKEIFWIDTEKRILVKRQILENNTIIKEINLVNKNFSQ